jgi:hypothetical protein
MILIIRSPNQLVVSHVPNNWEWASQENQFHHRIIKWDITDEHIQVARGKNKSIEFLGL